MRVVFWGSPAFAVPSLEAIEHSRHRVVGAVTQPDRARGRGGRTTPTPVARQAQRAGVTVLKPERPRGEAFMRDLSAFEGDVFVVAAYGEILPQEVLDMPPHGALNVHASLLPAYRGAAPVVQALLDGRDVTGVTIMRMDAGLDTGPICLQADLPIERGETAATLTERLASLGAEKIVEALDRLEEGRLPERRQPEAGASYAPKISNERARLDWSRAGAEIERATRAFDPWPGAWTTWRGERLKVFRVEPVAGAPLGSPGRLLSIDPDPVVGVGDGGVRLGVVQPAGGRRMSGAAWVRGRSPAVGEDLGAER